MPEQDEFGIAYVVKTIAEDVKAIRNDMQHYALKTETAYLSAKIEEFVPRQEIGARMSAYDETFKKFEKTVEDIRKILENSATKDDLKELKDEVREQYKTGPIAPWIVPLLALAFSIITGLVEIFDKLHK